MDVTKMFKSRESLLLLLIIVFSIAITYVNPAFMSLDNIADLLKANTVLGIFALGVLLVLISGGFDVSFTAIAQVVQYAVVYYFLQANLDNIYLAILCSIVIGGVMGSLNGVIIYYFKITAIIVTIATNSLFYGLLYVVTQGDLIYDIPPSFLGLAELKIFPLHAANGALYGISLVTCLWFLLALGMHLFLRHTVLGRSVYAIGGNPVSAERVGFNLKKNHAVYLYPGGSHFRLRQYRPGLNCANGHSQLHRRIGVTGYCRRGAGRRIRYRRSRQRGGHPAGSIAVFHSQQQPDPNEDIALLLQRFHRPGDFIQRRRQRFAGYQAAPLPRAGAGGS
ncbi:ABC transporter permease [Acerihabitans sp. KWT182]|uniref:ABC transporter permease n=1 Tax=Acerihabitans sp. KWT182 TaxID=3157919 RepID=A0AAU7QC46_9GAMM